MSHVQVPPDGAGKRVAHFVHLHLAYASGSLPFEIGDVVIGETSGLHGIVTSVTGDTTSGTIHLQLDSTTESDTASAGEDLQVGGVTKALASGIGTPVYAQATVAVGANNANYGQEVDVRGAASTRFYEGTPALDAFNNVRTSQASPIGYYDFVCGPQSELFWDDTASGGQVQHVSQNSLMLLSATTTSGSKARRVSHRYHFYQPGVGVTCKQSVVVGDAGKTNNTRSWGLGDANNGLFFELLGTSFGIVVRSNTSGSPVDTRIVQADWNVDKLDGTGLSQFNLDITKRNVYWIDYAWLGSGQIRFGVYGHEGERIIAHRVDSANAGVSVPYTESGSFPIAWSNLNTGTTSSTSELRIICGAVLTQSKPEYVFWRWADLETGLKSIDADDKPVLSVRAKTTYQSKPNRVGSYPEILAVFATGGPIKIDCYFGGTLTAASWDISGDGPLDGDEDASSATLDPGDKLCSFFLPAGASNLDLSKHFELTDDGVMLNADSVTRPPFIITATKLNGGDTVSVKLALTYRELS